MKKNIDKDQEDLLRILEAHGQQFLGSFGSNTLKGKRRDDTTSAPDSRKRAKLEHHSDEGSSDEWQGLGEDNDSESDAEASEDDDTDSSQNGTLHPHFLRVHVYIN